MAQTRPSGHCWPAPGRAQIARAVPAGSRRAVSQREFLARLQCDPELAQLRADRARNISECARVMARYADWADRTTRPTRGRVCAQAGSLRGGVLGLSTWKRARAWLEARGYLGTVVAGTTAALDGMRTSPALVDPDGPNTAAVYVLTVPRRKPAAPLPTGPTAINGPPSVSRQGHIQGHARATRRPGESGAGCAGALLRVGGRPPCGRAGQGITEGWAAHLAGPFERAGWTAADIAHAIDYEPGGAQHRYGARVASAVGWLRWRLARWLDDDGAPVASRSQQRAASRARTAAAAARMREQLAGLRAGWTDPAPHASAIRAALGWRAGKIPRHPTGGFTDDVSPSPRAKAG